MKNILITGCTRGIGRATAELLSNEGFYIYGIYHAASDDVITECKRLFPQSTLIKADLSDRNQVETLITQLKDVELYGIVNNAGVYIPENFKSYDMTVWDKVLQLHVTTPLMLASQLQSNLVEGGAIVNIASIYGAVFGGFSGVVYATSKAALSNLTKTLCNVFAYKKVRVNAVAPGMVETDLSAANGEAVLQAIKKYPTCRRNL
jgi:NAD(P)-dependent dehydrogenase (short-subunit alcohol dehydrogenase family)